MEGGRFGSCHRTIPYPRQSIETKMSEGREIKPKSFQWFSYAPQRYGNSWQFEAGKLFLRRDCDREKLALG